MITPVLLGVVQLLDRSTLYKLQLYCIIIKQKSSCFVRNEMLCYDSPFLNN
jgi:hypothetical protein